ncbi:golgin subfamily A member 6C [Anabrus simplex]|uniref:golgin subfamily A member 6C n=1 Tax=Anabrus simplex TaxID=316456 RepID=UPI0035A2D039
MLIARKVGSAQYANSHGQWMPRSPVSNELSCREKVPIRGPSVPSVSQDIKNSEMKLRKEVQELERKLQGKEQQKDCIRGNKNSEKKLMKKLKEMEKEQEKERVLLYKKNSRLQLTSPPLTRLLWKMSSAVLAAP